jgi:hypothetical protein
VVLSLSDLEVLRVKTRRAAVVVLAQEAQIALGRSAARNPSAHACVANAARHDALDDCYVTLIGSSYTVRAQIVTALRHFVDNDPRRSRRVHQRVQRHY